MPDSGHSPQRRWLSIRELNERDEVEFAEPSEFGVNDALYVPNDPDFPKLWGLRNSGQTVNGVAGTDGSDIRAVVAWDVGDAAEAVLTPVGGAAAGEVGGFGGGEGDGGGIAQPNLQSRSSQCRIGRIVA